MVVPLGPGGTVWNRFLNLGVRSRRECEQPSRVLAEAHARVPRQGKLKSAQPDYLTGLGRALCTLVLCVQRS